MRAAMQAPGEDSSSPHPRSEETHQQLPRRGGGNRLPLSCLACRNHKLRCDRQIPCGTCIRYNREARCRQNPAPQRASSKTSSKNLRGSTRSPATESAVSATFIVPGPGPRTGPGGRDAGSVAATVTDDRIASLNTPHSLPSLPRDDSCPVSEGLALLWTFDMMQLTLPLLPQLLAQLSGKDHQLGSWRSATNKQFRWMMANQQLCSVLPSRPQCDLLVNFYIEHVNWVFQSIHEPSFRQEYTRFWDRGLEKTDLIWTSLLFTIISTSALYVPLEAVGVVGFPRDAIRNLAHIWHQASLHALRAGNYESKPCLTQLQTYSVSQMYWYATNQIEAMNSRLAQAVRAAQALRLDRDTAPSKNLNDEMRHRIWWDLVDTDMFQTISLDRPPLIRLQSPGVPLPLNCRDSDLREDAVCPRPMDEPTEMSMNILKSRGFHILNFHYFSHAEDERRSYENILGLDGQLIDLIDGFPWYCQLNEKGSPPSLPEPLGERITWQHHIIRSCMHTQRIRMYREHLHRGTPSVWTTCVAAAQDSMRIYRHLRTLNTQTSRSKFFSQAYVVFSIAVTIVALLLVEGSLPIPNVHQQIRDMADDLGQAEQQGCHIPVAAHGRRLLLKMLELCEARVAARDSSPPQEAQSLVPDIAPILGGERTARDYLGRLRNAPSGQTKPASTENALTVEATGSSGVADSRREQGGDMGWIEADPTFALLETPHLAFPSGFSVDMDSDLFIEDMRRMGLLGWDMTGFLMTDSLMADEQ